MGIQVGLQVVAAVLRGMVHKMDMDLDYRVQVVKAVAVVVVHLRALLVRLVLNTRVAEAAAVRSTKGPGHRSPVVTVVRVLLLLKQIRNQLLQEL